MKRSNKKAQILVITLLVLTVITIVTVSLVSLVSRDITQVVATEKYEESFNVSENQLNKLLDRFSNTNISLTTLLTEFNTGDLVCIEQSVSLRKYLCSGTSTEFSNSPIYSEIEVFESRDIKDYVLYKDQALDIDLKSYTGGFEISWDKSASIEFGITYLDASGEVKKIKDVYDPLNLYDSFASISDNPYVDSLNIHNINFRDVSTMADSTSVLINPLESVDINGNIINANLISLTVIPRMDGEKSSILFNLNPTISNAPFQIRNFIAKSYESSTNVNNSTPVAILETKIPIMPQPNNILENSLTTEGTVLIN